MHTTSPEVASQDETVLLSNTSPGRMYHVILRRNDEKAFYGGYSKIFHFIRLPGGSQEMTLSGDSLPISEVIHCSQSVGDIIKLWSYL
jgi:hypothetical protein